MLQSIPTRIAGVQILRHTASRRADGSAVVVRGSASKRRGWLPYEELITAECGFTCEPSFTRRPVRRAVRCLHGELFVCLVDVRPDSPTFGHWQSICCRSGDGRQLVIPSGVACGWQVLSEWGTAEVRSSREVDPTELQWLCWDDCDLGLAWPLEPEWLASHRRASRRLRSIPRRRLPRMSLSRSRSQTATVATAPATTQPRPMNRAMAPGKSAEPSPQQSGQPPLTQTADKPRELILVIGSSGQLGRDLCRSLQGLGTVVGACRNPDRHSVLPVPVCIDISRPASLRQAIRQVRPTLIVNAAGLTDLDQAETQPRLAQLVNATAPALIADEAARIGAGLVHFCSGMVFDGSGDRPWRESDRPRPLNQYARTKLIGTDAVLHSQVPHLVLRCGWLYSTHGDNYVRRLIDLLAYRSSVTLADDHLGTPTSTNFLAGLTATLLSRSAEQPQIGRPRSITQWLSEHGGLYHASTLGSASKLIVGDQIVAACRQHALPIVLRKLQGRPLSELGTLATIPANCALDPTRLAMKFKLQLPSWQTDLNLQIDHMLGAHALPLGSVA